MSAIQTKQVYNIQNHHDMKLFENILDNFYFPVPSLSQSTPPAVHREGRIHNGFILPFDELLGHAEFISVLCKLRHHPFSLCFSQQQRKSFKSYHLLTPENVTMILPLGNPHFCLVLPISHGTGKIIACRTSLSSLLKVNFSFSSRNSVSSILVTIA